MNLEAMLLILAQMFRTPLPSTECMEHVLENALRPLSMPFGCSGDLHRRRVRGSTGSDLRSRPVELSYQGVKFRIRHKRSGNWKFP